MPQLTTIVLLVAGVVIITEACWKSQVQNCNQGGCNDRNEKCPGGKGCSTDKNENCIGTWCRNRHQDCPGGGCVQLRRKRAAPDTVQNALTEFDVRLTEELSGEILDMSPEEKQTFAEDLSKMNEAVKTEIASIDKNVRNAEELLQQISDKVTQDFGARKWFKRLRSIAGDKISQLISEAVTQ